MATTGHESELINVGGLKASLQKLKTDIIDGKVESSSVGAASGVASLDESGLVPSTQLPSYVDDVVELLAITDTAPEHCAKGDLYFNTTTSKVVRATATDTWGTGPTTNTDPEKGKIYVNLSDDKTYRWSGSTMVATPSSDFTGIKVGSSGSTLTPSQGVITIPEYETGAQVNPSVMGASGSTHASGLVPDTASTAGTSKYLREDGTWAEPAGGTDTTYKLNINGTEQGGGTTSLGTVYAPTTAGTEGQMLIANASGIPAWGSKPTYGYGEIGYAVATTADNGNTSGAITLDGGNSLYVLTLTGDVTSVTFTSGKLPAVGHSCHVIFTATEERTVSIAHSVSGTPKYICPAGANPDDLEVPANGYVEIDLLNADGTNIYVRGI